MSISKKVDYTQVCWNCEGHLLKNKGSYVQCSSCGATWNPVIKLGPPIVTIEKEHIKDKQGNIITTTRYRPVAKHSGGKQSEDTQG